MKVKVFVDWYNQVVYSENDFLNEIAEVAKKYENDEEFFTNWLEENFFITEVFYFSDKEKEKEKINFSNFCKHSAREVLETEFEVYEIEI